MKKAVICSAFLKEIRPLVHFFKAEIKKDPKRPYPVYSCEKEGWILDFIVSGMGPENTARRLKDYIGRCQPDRDCLWILTGYCGGADPSLKAGDAVIPSLVADASGEYAVPADEQRMPAQKGVLFSSPHVVEKKEKQELCGRDPRISAVDMEAGAFMRVMRENGIAKFFIYKVVIDSRDYVFPDRELIRGSIWKVPLILLLKKIRQLPAVLILYGRMARASQRILRYFRESLMRMKFPTERS